MKGLKCETHNCEHNFCEHCNAGIINIGKSGDCCTKQKREYGSLEQKKCDFEMAADFDYDKNMEVMIQCDSTKCQFNHNNFCSSQTVNIGDGMFKTKCFSKIVAKNN
ncbi:MAG: hypothetical protein RSD04_00720 [Clostridia bacterium]